MKTIFSFLICGVMTVMLCFVMIGCTDNDSESLPSNEGQHTFTDADISQGLSSNSEQQELADTEQDTSQNDYSIIKLADKHYIAFDDISVYEDGSQSQLATLSFDSLAEFKDRVTNNKLYDWERRVIATAFEKDENGILTCDFNSLYEPSTPAGCYVDYVIWSGEIYGFYITTDIDTFGFVSYYTQSMYNESFQSDYESFFEKDTVTVNDITETDEQKTIVNFSTNMGEFMKIRYEITNGNRKITVDETYRLAYVNDSMSVSSSVPSRVTLYCEFGNIRFIVNLYDFTEKPTAEWLAQFGMKPYVESYKE